VNLFFCIYSSSAQHWQCSRQATLNLGDGYRKDGF
jgi:hypothetical protein